MRRLTYRYGPVEGMPAILGQVTARERFRHSCEVLGVLLAEPVELVWTDEGDDGLRHMHQRWILASAYAVITP